MRQFAAPAVAVLAAAALLAGCSDSGSTDSSPTSGATGGATSGEPTAASDGGSILVWADDTRAAALKSIEPQFEEETGVTLEVVVKDYESIRDDFVSQAPTGEGPDIVLAGDNAWVAKYVENGVISPIELGDKLDEFVQNAIDSFTLDGQVYGVPTATENIGLVRNVDLAPEAPATWDDLLATGNALVAAGTAKYPVLVQQDETIGDPYHLYPLQMSFGTPFFGTDADGNYDVNQLELGNEGGLKFAQWLYEMGQQGVLRSTINYDIAQEAFVDGESPFIITGPWMAAEFDGMNVTVDPIPSAGGQTAAPFVGTSGFVLSAYAKNPLAATNFLVNYLATKEGQLAVYEATGRPSSMIAAIEDPAIADNPVIAGFAEVSATGVSQPGFAVMDEVWRDVGAAEIAILNGGDPTSTWTAMVDKLQTTIAQSS